jgi:transposase
MKAEVLSGPERRRRWSTGEKEQVVAEALVLGANVAAIARRHGVSRSLVYAWRREARVEPGGTAMPALVPVVLASGAEATTTKKRHAPPTAQATQGSSDRDTDAGVIEIALSTGERVMLRGAVDLKALRAVLAVLRG